MIVDRPTIAESYSSATGSIDLAPLVEQRCDVDYLIACGWIHDGLGAILVRVASEWDCVSAELRLARARVQNLEREAQRIERMADRSPDAQRTLSEGQAIMRQAVTEATTAQLLAMGRMKSLRAAEEAVADFALAMAECTRFHAPERMVRSLAEHALATWLDCLCHSCSGRGFHGGFGSPLILCKICHGTGRPRNSTGSPRLVEFVKALQAEMDRKVSNTQQRMKKWLRQHA